MPDPVKTKRSKEQLQTLRELCSEFSLRELVDEKVKQVFDQMESLDGRTCSKGEIYSCIMGEVEKSLIDKALKKTKGNKARTAEILGINRNTLRRKLNSRFK